MRLHLRVVVAYGAVAEVLCIDWFNDRMVFSMPPKVLYVSGAMLVPPLPQAERCPDDVNNMSRAICIVGNVKSHVPGFPYRILGNQSDAGCPYMNHLRLFICVDYYMSSLFEANQLITAYD